MTARCVGQDGFQEDECMTTASWDQIQWRCSWFYLPQESGAKPGDTLKSGALQGDQANICMAR